VVERGSNITAKHAKKIKDHAYARPVVITLKAPDKEDDAEHHP